MAWTAMRRFLATEPASGVVLLAAAGLAVALSNSPLRSLYDALLAIPLQVRLGALDLAKPLSLWINDGLMAIFFLLVGLEIKREIAEGQLSRPSQAALPVIGALGGMIMPALVYLAINRGMADNLGGWAIPAATDIAFALGVLALLGRAAPPSLKIFLTALAILDDLGAIVIIALFYTADLSPAALTTAAAAIALLLLFNRLGVTRFGPYMLVGILLWVAVLKSGVHATLAGVVLALCVPLRAEGGASPLHRLEHILQPWVAFGIMPVFAFANAGVPLGGVGLTDLADPLPLGIALGLFIGKQAGVLAFCWAAIRLGLAGLPPGADWRQFHGAALLTGIGFTMSLFIGNLAFDRPDQLAAIRLGVLGGSLLAAISGYLVLKMAARRKR